MSSSTSVSTPARLKNALHFAGSQIRLEIWNSGPLEIQLTQGMPICQLIFEEVHGTPDEGYSGQFRVQGPAPRPRPTRGRRQWDQFAARTDVTGQNLRRSEPFQRCRGLPRNCRGSDQAHLLAQNRIRENRSFRTSLV